MTRGWVGALALLLGSGAQLQQASLWPIGMYAICLGLGLLACVASCVRNRSWWVIGLAVFAVAFGLTGARAALYQQGALSAELEGRELLVEGWVAGLPREGESGTQFEWVTAHAWHAGQPVDVPHRVRLSWRGDGLTDLKPGQYWRLTVRLERPHGLANPGGFDAELWMWEQGFQASGSVRRGRDVAEPRLLESTWRYPVSQAREAMRSRLQAHTGGAEGTGIVLALSTGDQSLIPASQWEVFRLTGVIHLVVVSGMHVTFFSWLAMLAVGLVWRQAGGRFPGLLLTIPVPVAAGCGGVLLGLAYAVFSGWGVPAQRAVFMLSALVVLQLLGRRWPWPMIWLGVMAFVVLIDPWAMMRPGFWLSFVAVAVLFAVGNPLHTWAQGWKESLHRMVRTQALVTVALAPLTLMWFGQFSVVGLIANLLAIPWVTLVLTPLALAGACLPWFWTLAVWASDAMLIGLQWLAGWPMAAVYRPATPWPLAVVGVLGGLLLVSRLPWAYRGWGILLIWPVLAYTPPRPAQGDYEWLAADVGQGTAVIIRTRHHTLVYDSGPPMGSSHNAAERVIIPLLRRQGESPDRVVISHRDADHSSGMEALAAAYPEADWRLSFVPPGGWQAPALPCVAGDAWEWDGVPFRFLHPRPDDYGSRLSSNAMSCVLMVGHPDNALLLTGDITIDEENRLVLGDPGLRARVLFAGHHGSKTSNGPLWLNTLQPRVVVVQSGHRNRYGHPAPEVVQRLQARDIHWVNTPSCGAAFGRSTQSDRVFCQRDVRQRYWHFAEHR
jgi:competence protein ComEC